MISVVTGTRAALTSILTMDEMLVTIKRKIDMEDQGEAGLDRDHVQGPEIDAVEDVTVHQEGKMASMLSFYPFYSLSHHYVCILISVAATVAIAIVVVVDDAPAAAAVLEIDTAIAIAGVNEVDSAPKSLAIMQSLLLHLLDMLEL